jgi:hypothetical protein
MNRLLTGVMQDIAPAKSPVIFQVRLLAWVTMVSEVGKRYSGFVTEPSLALVGELITSGTIFWFEH